MAIGTVRRVLGIYRRVDVKMRSATSTFLDKVTSRAYRARIGPRKQETGTRWR